MENLLDAVSPSGDSVAVIRRAADQINQNQIWLMRADGTESHRLTNIENGIYSNLSWSPDGQELLYDEYLTNSTQPETRFQYIDVRTGTVHDLGTGSSPVWVWSK